MLSSMLNRKKTGLIRFRKKIDEADAASNEMISMEENKDEI